MPNLVTEEEFKAEVTDFIEEHPFLIPLLDEAESELTKFFPRFKKSVKVVSSCESPDDRFLLMFVSVPADQDPLEADEILDRFDSEWWLDNLHKAKGLMLITLGFCDA